MSIRLTSQFARSVFTAATVIGCLANASISQADVLTGSGAYPPPGGVSFHAENLAGEIGGRTRYYDSLNPSAYNDLWWGPANINATMNNYLTDNDVLTLQTYSGQQAIFSGLTSMSGTFYTGDVEVKYIATITGASPWMDPSTVGIFGDPLLVAEITGTSFSVNEQFLARKAGTADAFIAFNDFYDNQHGGSTSMLRSGSSGEFFYTDAVAAVPEPSTWAMMVLGFAGVGFVAYRKRSPSHQRFRLT